METGMMEVLFDDESIREFMDIPVLCSDASYESPKEVELEGKVLTLFTAKWLIQPEKSGTSSRVWATTYSLQPYELAQLMVEDLGSPFIGGFQIPLLFYYKKTKWFLETGRLTVFVKTLHL